MAIVGAIVAVVTSCLTAAVVSCSVFIERSLFSDFVKGVDERDCLRTPPGIAGGGALLHQSIKYFLKQKRPRLRSSICT